MIVKAKHTSEFFQMNNESIQDPSLSWSAKGLLAYFMSLPEAWEVHLRDLFVRSRDGRRATEAALKELEAAGYVKKEQGKTSGVIQNIRSMKPRGGSFFVRYKHKSPSPLCTKRTQTITVLCAKRTQLCVQNVHV